MTLQSVMTMSQNIGNNALLDRNRDIDMWNHSFRAARAQL